MNKVILIGRLVTDPEIRRTNNDKAVATYRLAVDRQRKTEGQPDADFISCVTWGNNAEFAEKYLHKGIKIAVEGRISTRNYDGKDGKKVFLTEVVVDHHEFCESKQSNGGYSAPQGFTELPDDDGDLPF